MVDRDSTNRRVDPGPDLSHTHYNSRIGDLFLMVNSSDEDVQRRALATTDWQDVSESDAVALLAPLATHSSAEVRELVALQLATTAGSAKDPRALQALITLAADNEPTVRAAAARSSYIANEFSLTADDQSATSPANRFVNWEQEGETTTFSFRCPDIATAKRFLAIVTGLSAREMVHRSKEGQTPPPLDQTDDIPTELKRLPDVILDDEQPEVFDLPRQGVPKAVLDVSKGTVRLPDVLIDE